MSKKLCLLLSILVASSSVLSKSNTEDAVLIDIHLLLDRSGSMTNIGTSVVENLNNFIVQQQNETAKNVQFSLIQFDTMEPHQVTIDSENIMNVKPLTLHDFKPRGGTPLYDAIGQVISRAEQTHSSEKNYDRNGRMRKQKHSVATVVVIFTDGEENSSKKHNAASIKKLISAKEEEGWAFIYMGANVDAFAESKIIGLKSSSSQNYIPDRDGVRSAFSSMSNSFKRYARIISAAALNQEESEFVELQKSAAADMFDDSNNDAQKDYESRMKNQQL